MSSDSHRRLYADSIRSGRKEKVVYVSIGCSVEAQASRDQQLPRGLEKYFSVRQNSNMQLHKVKMIEY